MPYFCPPGQSHSDGLPVNDKTKADFELSSLLAGFRIWYQTAKVAHLVEHDLAKVGVAGSSPVFRSRNPSSGGGGIFFGCPGGGIGRHAGLK